MGLLGVQQIAADHLYIREEFSFPGSLAPGEPLLLRARAKLVRSVSQKLRFHSQQSGVHMILEHTGKGSGGRLLEENRAPHHSGGGARMVGGQIELTTFGL